MKKKFYFSLIQHFAWKIYEQKYENQNCIFIELVYLGQYEYIFEQFKIYEQFQNDVINSLYFYGYNYITEIIHNGLFPTKNNVEDNKEYNNLNVKNSINFIHKILFEKIINVNFTFSSREKYRIQSNPFIKVKELIIYFLESLNSNNF